MEYNVLSRPIENLGEYLKQHGMVVHAYAYVCSILCRGRH
jgi:hypothetical protein